MIETLSIRNFKVLREVDVRLRPLTLIVGPNASGKSSLLQTLLFLSPSLTHQRVRLVEIRTKGTEAPMSVGCRGILGAQPYEAHFDFRVMDLRFEPGAAIDRIGSAVDLRLDPARLSEPSVVRNLDLTLPSSGAGLAAILASLSLEHPRKFRSLVARLTNVVPTVQDVRLTRRQIARDEVGFEILFDMKGAGEVRAASASEGTLLTLGLLTVLTAPNAPKLVLIDDLERGLHPRALGELIQLLRKVQEQDPELQIVATSHSPYLLDHLQAEEILLTALDEDGYAVVRSLAEHPDYERWKDVMAPGEFWSTVGESWVTAAKK